MPSKPCLLVPTLLLVSFGTWFANPSVWGQAYTTVVNNGASSNRVDIVFVGDGYLASDLSTTYAQHVTSQVNYIFNGNQDPFPRYRNFFNVHRVNTASNERGADKPPQNIFVNTAFDSSYWWDGVTERLLYLDTNKANAAVTTALSGSGIDVDIRLATVNDAKYGGGGGQWAVFSGQNTSAREIALHELGHSFGLLADEYFTNGTTYPGGEPTAVNVTRSSSTGKWNRWVGYNDPSSNIGVIDYYQGGQYYQNGIYRPSDNSKMRSLNRPFDAISREQFISRIYAEVDPLDGWLGNGTVLQDPTEIWVDTIDPAVIAVEWSLNGTSLGNLGENLNLAGIQLAPGNYQVLARAYDQILDHRFSGDTLDWYRLTNTAPLQQQIQWQIRVSPRLGDFNLNGDYECGDIDALVAAVVNGGSVTTFDMNADGLLNPNDVDVWLATAGEAELTSGNPYRYGDANLDGVVDGSDFGLWNSHKFTLQPAWCRGDFSADGQIDGTDFGLWNANKFQSADAVASRSLVPEPCLSVTSLVVILATSLRTQRGKNRPTGKGRDR
jgi:IgA Peptidase M64